MNAQFVEVEKPAESLFLIVPQFSGEGVGRVVGVG